MSNEISLSNKTSLKQLIEAGILTMEQVEALSKGEMVIQSPAPVKKSKSSAPKVDESFAQTVYETMIANPDKKWKTGHLVQIIAGLVKSDNPETEAARYKSHAEISKALSHLSATGRIVKNPSANACHTFYSVVPQASLVPVQDESPVDESPESTALTVTDDSAE